MNESIAIETIGHITQAAKDCIELRRARKVESVWLIFNELPLRITAKSTMESVCDDYDILRREHHYGEHCPMRAVGREPCTGAEFAGAARLNGHPRSDDEIRSIIEDIERR